MKRVLLAVLLLIVVAVVAGALIWFNVFSNKMTAQFFANMPVPTVTISTVEVQPVDWTPGIEAVGTVQASQGVDVAVEVGGIVKDIRFKANDRVSAGQLLVQIDDAVERAGLLGARSSLATAREALERTQRLLDRGVSTVADLQSSQNQVDTAQGSLATIEATIDQKAIKAPFAGTIGIPKIDVGQYVQPATVVATLQDLETMKVNFTVPEQQLSSLSIGQAAQFGLNEGELPYGGQLSGIDPKIDPSSRLVSVQAQVANSDGVLRPGQFIRVRVNLPEEKGIIALPQTAVTVSLYGSYVYVVEEAPAKEGEAAPAAQGAAGQAPAGPKLVARQVFVETGRRVGDKIEITRGLKAGAQVVTAGQNKLSPGSPVAIDNSVQPAGVAEAQATK
ncbi:efflux RND transporter periplasmic adaptor subunit [Prosthecomicrobium pneumaticum]|uniref:Membrane fusion protein (Multidrug efflux system) n=1 Tax=Prosthecomicrobium pneumaticum TaxID=81895 RepID=A0A7W9CVC8_9HYPH|nr:efflux RND transporter periplasmic adaptor subunit [Prosthecomicrobium pneumaticum]MBB5752374.1 membrane fusion protein (multidrug efflux system) [Prosthecomicrobium pneumaticum]